MTSQLKMVIRANYSNPPAHGARVVSVVLSDPALFEEWKVELKGMSGRIIQMRRVLYDALIALKTPGDWTHITSQIGMFSFTGLSVEQCKVLSEKCTWQKQAKSTSEIALCPFGLLARRPVCFPSLTRCLFAFVCLFLRACVPAVQRSHQHVRYQQQECRVPRKGHQRCRRQCQGLKRNATQRRYTNEKEGENATLFYSSIYCLAGRRTRHSENGEWKALDARGTLEERARCERGS